MIQYTRTLNNNIHHSNKREPPPIFLLKYQYLATFCGPICWQNPYSGCNSGTDLIVVLEYIVFFIFFPTPNKSLRFTRSRRSYVNRTAVVLTKHCQSYFFLEVHCSKQPRSFFRSCLSPVIVHLRNLFLLSTRVAQMLLAPRWEADEKMWNSYS